MIGLLCAVGALLSWTGFAVGNSRCLARLDHISAHDWNLLIGVVTGAQALALIPVSLLTEPIHHDADAWPRFRSDEHTSALQSLMRISYAVFCLKKTNSVVLIYSITISILHTLTIRP